MNDEQRIARGQRAQSEMSLTEEVFDGVRTVLIEQLVELPPTEPEQILEVHRSIQNLARVRKAMMAVINDGMVVAKAVEIAALTRG
jgi:hypothetical protein